MEKPTKITITLPTNAYFISGIRDFTLALIRNTTNFAEKWAYRMQSVVDELCNNAIEFGSAQDSEIKVTFEHKEDEYIEITVEDTGTGKVKVKAADMQEIIEERTKDGYKFTELRGRGLAKIVKEWTDELEFSDKEGGGLIIRTRKYLKDPRYKSGLPESTATHLVLEV
ncbi:MAG: ATP-binding protein [Candidatus Gracilibacteria bacterium]